MAVEAYGKENRQEGKKPSRHPPPTHTHTFPTGAVHLSPDLGAFWA